MSTLGGRGIHGGTDPSNYDINGGTIDGATIGASSPSTGSFTTLATSSTVTHSGLTASQVVTTNGSKQLASSSNVTAFVSAASDSVAGKVELATDAETTTGTATDRATTPANITARFASPPAIGGTAAGDIQGKVVHIVKSSSGSLTAQQCTGTVVTNYGQGAADVAVTLPTAAAGMSIIAVIGTTQAGNTWKLTADTNDKIYLDGVAGTDNQSVIVTPAVGNFITLFTFQTGSSAYDWIAQTGQGTWTAGA